MNAADVLIIGAGPTGAVAAKRFAEAGMPWWCLSCGALIPKARK